MDTALPGDPRDLFDEQTSDASQLAYYRELFDDAHRKIKNGIVASNPGVPCDAGYVGVARADVISIFEHHDGYDKFAPPDGWSDDERRHGAVLPYDTRSTEQMRERLRRAREQGLGYFYATDDNGANPWDRLPTYWDDEVAAVRKLNGERK